MTVADRRYAEMVAELCRAERYPQATAVAHLETHISDVFLAGDYAYKLKKPVDLGFVDFTSLDKRRRACDDEVRLNARLAPTIYLGVVPVCHGAGGYRIADDTCMDDETIADYVVRMVRMPQAGMLDRMAAAGRLEAAHMIDIARQMARFHANAERGPAIDRYGDLAAVAQPIRQNFAQTEKYVGQTIGRAQFEQLRRFSESFLAENVELFAARVAGGHIVDGHGDLHLRNMCLYREHVVIFDCIEFNQALRAGDTINDIAFLTMDLDDRGLPGLGNVFLNAYLEQTRDYAGLALLDFYQVYRAYVRGKVLSFLLDGAADDAQRERARREAAGYFHLAQGYLDPRAAGILVTCGLSGSGKTTAARQAAAALGGITVRSDAIRKHLAGMALGERGDAGYGEGIYAPQMTDRTYSALLGHAREIVGAGRWAILDATYGTRARRDAVAALASELGVGLGILHCVAPRAELLRRLAARAAEGSDISDAGGTILDEQARRFETPTPAEAPTLTWTGQEDIKAWLATLGTAR